MPRPSLLAVVAVALAVTPAAAQFPNDPFDKPIPRSFAEVGEVKAEFVPAKAKRGETVTLRITVTPKPDTWTYPAHPADPAQVGRNTFRLPEKPGDLIFVTPVTDPPGAKTKPRDPPGPAGTPDQVYYGPTTWEFTAVVSPKATPGKKQVGLAPLSSAQVCTKENCFTEKVPAAALEVLDGEVPVDPKFRDAVEAALAGKPLPVGPGGAGNGGGPKPRQPDDSTGHTATKAAKPIDQYVAELDDLRARIDAPAPPPQGIWGFVLTAAVWGLISLVTPCVFPMIPITVSIFLKHAHGSFRERMKLAGVYCLTIIGVLGLSAFALLKFMAALSINPVTNVVLGLIFVVLALSLFGMYDLALPGFLGRRLQAKQAKGGVLGTVFGALAFTVISFTCVAPFLGGFAGISAASSAGGATSLIALPSGREVLGGLAFATAFAAPFFVLALVPGLLKALPKSGGWLDSVKVVMGFLELAAALKFFRTAELRSPFGMSFFTYDLVLAGWVGICFASALYLFNTYRLPHDEERPNIGVVRMLFAVMFLGLGLHLLPAMFKHPDGTPQRPNGEVYAWVNAFLLPEPLPPNRAGAKDSGTELVWGTDLTAALNRSREEGLRTGTPRPVLIDFTGKTCSNCRYNEETVFTRPEVRELFKGFERVQLYTDEVPEELFATDPGYEARGLEAEANKKFQVDAFRTNQLPLYVALVPKLSDKSVVVLGVYDEGKINSAARFAAWLKEMQEKAAK